VHDDPVVEVVCSDYWDAVCRLVGEGVYKSKRVVTRLRLGVFPNPTCLGKMRRGALESLDEFVARVRGVFYSPVAKSQSMVDL